MSISYCLICKEQVDLQITWKSLIPGSETNTCDSCYQTLVKINMPTCPGCFRPQNNHDLCPDCQSWEKDTAWKGILERNVSVYEYNDAMKEILSTYKFRGDAALVAVFEKDFYISYKANFKKKSIDATIPIPLSPERLYERGFNQAKLLADFLPLLQLEVLERTHHEKQSKKSRHERLSSSNVFSITNRSIIEGKNILLIDDIYTTGTTLRHAAQRLKEVGAASVSSLTLIRS
ncbi:ComF family protein [Metabacillus schmidteae]|uniref:ComF family protein n=1 Tax=Metabacillus schmidteae TaxID=2730405 RepID=UPI00158D395F|nr:ComF family protein [Metabacillus schmidteae]